MTSISSDRTVGLSTRFTGSDLRVVGAALLALAGGAAWLAGTVSGHQAAAFLLGGAFGLVLYHAAFGFTTAFRVFFTERRGAGLRAQMLMLAIACTLFFPSLAAGSLFGHPVHGYLFPIGASVAIGAFLFGIGMQVANGCASGTLFHLGGGRTTSLIVIVFFIVGSTAGTFHLPWWQHQPRLETVSFVLEFGWLPALALNLALFGAIAGLTVVLEKRRHGRLLDRAHAGISLDRLLRGPWPLIWGAVTLALLNAATLAIAGRPWGITSAFSLWGSKILQAQGADVAFWDAWAAPADAEALAGSLLTDMISVMDVGVVLGALLAAGLAGRFVLTWRVPPRALAGAVLGGLLLGYGSRIAYGCNISAYFSGIASGSLHGWVWIAAALAGNGVGVALRPLFGLPVERSPEARP